MEQRLTIITLGVKNLTESRRFYEEVVGWKPEKNSSGEIVFFKLNGIMLSLFPREELANDANIPSAGAGFKGFSLAQNLRSELEVDELFNQLGAKGVMIIKPPQKAFWGGYSGYIADPDGNLWEIAYNPYLSLDSAGNVIPT